MNDNFMSKTLIFIDYVTTSYRKTNLLQVSRKLSKIQFFSEITKPKAHLIFPAYEGFS